jgi:hypothetical protein
MSLTFDGTNGITTPALLNGGANGSGNIGSASSYFNTVFAKATSAQYADLAENYLADRAYPAGTVVEFGGATEVTISSQSHSNRVAGVVSTQPAYQMNTGLTGECVAVIALIGRVPCQVVGTIAKGDCVVASDIPGVATALDPTQYRHGCVLGKSLENYQSDQVGTISVVVGRG